MRWQDGSTRPCHSPGRVPHPCCGEDYIYLIVGADVLVLADGEAPFPGNVLVPVLQGKWVFHTIIERAASIPTVLSSELFSRSWVEAIDPERSWSEYVLSIRIHALGCVFKYHMKFSISTIED